MGAWNVSITGNDTAQDLKYEYQAAFYYYDVETALEKLDAYVRTHICRESDEEEWCNYYYSLADFMWRKGILTDAVRDRAVQMIDEDFGLGLWAEDEKTLQKRKKALAEFREKLLSPQGEKKKIRVKLNLESVFEVGDVVAFRLKTADKSYIPEPYGKKAHFDEAFFKACDGKYVVMRKAKDDISYRSMVVPEVADHWIIFQLYGKIFEEIPTMEELSTVGWAHSEDGNGVFLCESSLYYFKRRDFQVIGHDGKHVGSARQRDSSIFFSVNVPHYNADSLLIEAITLSQTEEKPPKRSFLDFLKPKKNT
jgi:hypothetical protein